VSLRTIVILGLALALGGSAAVGVSALVGAKGPVATNAETSRIVVATADVARGSMITSDLIKERDCPKDLIPLGAITKVEDALQRAVFSPLVKGEAVLEGKLAPKGAGRGMAALVPKGMRAFTITTPNITSGVAGFVMPGNKVDVLLTVNATQGGTEDRTGGGSTTTLLQHVEILAVDQRIDAPVENKVDPNELRSVTLLVSPDQASMLDLGQAKGTLHLSLRNPEDDLNAHTRPATVNDLRFFQDKPWDERAKGVLAALGKLAASNKPKAEEPPPPPPPAIPTALVLDEPPPQPRTVWIFRGIQKSPAN
jgi:pilus assembly protein CpaB